MATKKPTATARALQHMPHFGIACGDVVEAEKSQIDNLAAAGYVDPDDAAVAYAKGQGARTVTLDDAPATAELAAAGDTAATDADATGA
ncbi:hypothetical protein [Brachymonas sp.]|uniref:hypothetical protein n=1 Tax=Brachymonas sp. TaxID=1936292 RepID=UPI0035B3DB71